MVLSADRQELVDDGEPAIACRAHVGPGVANPLIARVVQVVGAPADHHEHVPQIVRETGAGATEQVEAL